MNFYPQKRDATIIAEKGTILKSDQNDRLFLNLGLSAKNIQSKTTKQSGESYGSSYVDR